jgi:proteasome accessory factor C
MAENATLRALRLLDLVPFILRNPGISIKALATEFSVSTDEMLKDLNLLFMCGLPGYTPLELIDISFDEGYVVVRDPQNLDAPRNFNESEALALRVALATLLEITPSNHRDYEKIKTLSTKISAAFCSEIPRGAIDFVANKEKQIFDAIESALQSEKDLEIVYLNVSRDSSSTRKVTPGSLSISPEKTLLKAFCHLAKGPRSFNLQFIKSATVVDRIPHQHYADNFDEEQTKVILTTSSVDSEFIKENQGALSKLSESPGFTTYEIGVFQLEWIVRSIIADPHALVLTEPKEIRQAIVERCATALDQYGVIG